ncbi:hypothetical protein KEM54_000174 [Ascosphaera aggregata]|nr:hypothetical protein KEM54_000174 [Ascosphaera aggregata]
MRSPNKPPRRIFRERKPPRQHSADVLDPDNQTDHVIGQEDWSIDNLPEILYQFRPDSSQPQIRRDLNIPTKPSPWKNSRDLRCFDILPDRISSNVEEFRVEAWMRLDRRIQLHDITDRMNPEFRVENNALQQRGVRFRKAFNLLAWGTGNRKTEQMAQILEEKMREKGIDPTRNSTRGLTPGLIDVLAGEAGGRILVPEPYRSRYPSQIDCAAAAAPAVAPAGSACTDADESTTRRIPIRATKTSNTTVRSSRSISGSSDTSGTGSGSITDSVRLPASSKAAHFSFVSDSSDFGFERYDDDTGAFSPVEEEEEEEEEGGGGGAGRGAKGEGGVLLEYDHPYHPHHQDTLSFHERYPLLNHNGYTIREPFEHEMDFESTPPDTMAFGSFNGLIEPPSQSFTSSTTDVGSSFSSDTPSAASDEDSSSSAWIHCPAYVQDMTIPQHHHNQLQQVLISSSSSSSGGGGGGGIVGPSTHNNNDTIDHKIPLGAETLCWERIGPDSPRPTQPAWPFVEYAVQGLQGDGLSCISNGRWVESQTQNVEEMDIKGIFHDQQQQEQHEHQHQNQHHQQHQQRYGEIESDVLF